jgi:hypothetical protein
MPYVAAHPGSSSMSLSDQLTIIAIAVAVIAAIASAWAVRRWGVRRRKVLLTHESAQLIPRLPVAANSALKVTFQDFPIDDPYLLQLRLQNIGSLDVTSSDFDAGQHIILKTNCKLYGLISTSHPESTITTALGSDGAIEISPLLLKRKEEWEAPAIVSGRPRIESKVPLANTDVLDRRVFDAKVAQSLLVRILRAVGPVTPGGGVIWAAIEALVFDQDVDQDKDL